MWRETFITPNFEPFIDLLLERVDLSQVTMQFSTNDKCKPSPSLTNKLKQFKEINFNVSLDSVHPVNDYQRQGSNYRHILSMYNYLVNTFDNCMPSVHMTQSIYTAPYLADSLVYLDSKQISYTVDFVTDPLYLNIQSVPEPVKQWIRESNSHHAKANSLVNSWLQKDRYSHKTWSEAQLNTSQLDEYYSVKLADYSPQLAQWLDCDDI